MAVGSLKSGGKDGHRGRRILNDKREAESYRAVVTKRPRFCEPVSKDASRAVSNSVKTHLSLQRQAGTTRKINGGHRSSVLVDTSARGEAPTAMPHPAFGDKVRPIDDCMDKVSPLVGSRMVDDRDHSDSLSTF
jgi:hypothetical protein